MVTCDDSAYQMKFQREEKSGTYVRARVVISGSRCSVKSGHSWKNKFRSERYGN